MADPEQFTPKGKLVLYTGELVELYNQRNHRQVHEIYGMIELEKMCASIVENPRNLGVYRIIEISSILCSAHMIPRDQDKVIFYINNYINWDQYNQLYDPDWIEKGIKNVDAVAYKLGLALPRAINQRLEVAREEKRKKEEIVKRWKTEAMVAKHQQAKREISSFIEEEENYESDTKDKTDLDQANDDKNQLQLWEEEVEESYKRRLN